jgi:uncharacterized cupin superfamily protein
MTPLTIDTAAVFNDDEWSDVDPARVTDGSRPRAAARVIYASADEKFCAGIYACTAGTWRVSYSEDELCTLLEGRVRLIGDDGTHRDYVAPQSFVIPKGFQGLWQAGGNLRKIFVIYEPGS